MDLIKGKQEKAQKVVIYGPEGIGKSTFASKFPEPVFIDVESGSSELDIIRTPTPSSYAILKQQISMLKCGYTEFRTLVIDTADWTERLIIEEICNKFQINGIEGIGYGKGYTYLEEEFGRFLNSLQDIVDMGINVVICAHAKITKFEQPDELGAYDRWELKLQKKTAPLLKEWADMVLFANYETHVINVDNQGAVKGKNKAQGGKRVMYTTHTPSWDAKNRKGLADKLDFDYKEIERFFLKDLRDKELKEIQNNHKESKIEKNENIKDDNKSVDQVDNINKIDSNDKSDSSNDVAKFESVDISTPFDNDKSKQLVGNKALNDLMIQNNVTVEQIQNVVSLKGYYPSGTPIENYDPGFVSGVLVGAWEQVYAMIKGGM
ncbi:ATP-binding protein [Peptostreptococcus sp. D1]|uniref:ATP-binding protein n=1 Tax=Peptostreptococcus sp. D1 TaxID=72304 RepID=UPI0008F155FD|nr:ATP-binding protein [Peptostreptococcus sp. D1]SFE38809.1 AAA domain-containing protein [Peptostreptococcus sp. D1]